jgi:hypothetical protein
MDSVHSKIIKSISKRKKGELVFPADFKAIGSQAAIKTSLTRLYKQSIIERIAQGIYIIPKKDPVLGTIRPSLEDVAYAIARRDKARIIPSGAHALNKLGISTQVPTKLVFLTDGAPRLIKIGNRTINFKATVPKKLMTKGEISGLVIQAMSELTQSGITPDIEQKLKTVLRQEKISNLKHDAELAPAWIADKLRSFAAF